MATPAFALSSPVSLSSTHTRGFLSPTPRPSSTAAVRRTVGPVRLTPTCSDPVSDEYVWVDAVQISEVDGGTLARRILCGLDVCIACANDGQVYAVGNKGTPLGVPLSEGKVVDIDVSSCGPHVHMPRFSGRAEKSKNRFIFCASS